MDSPHKISVIIPTYNRQAYVCDAIDSALCQTHPVHEIIIIDDGSTDGTESVLRNSYGDRIKFIAQANQGPSEARNAGIRASCGNWLAFLDSDDLWEPNKIEEQMRFIAANPDKNIGIVDTFSIVTDETGATVYKGTLIKSGDSFKDLLTLNVINGTPSVLMNKACVADVGYMDTDLGGAEDHEYWLRVASKYSVYTVEQFLTIIRKHDANVSNDKLLMVESYKQFERIVVSRYRDRLNEADVDNIRAHRLLYSMIVHFKTGNFTQYRYEMREAIRIQPSLVVGMPKKYFLLYILSCFGIKLARLFYRKFDV